jgi:N12 class adenine-specific DNA methylase
MGTDNDFGPDVIDLAPSAAPAPAPTPAPASAPAPDLGPDVIDLGEAPAPDVIELSPAPELSPSPMPAETPGGWGNFLGSAQKTIEQFAGGALKSHVLQNLPDVNDPSLTPGYVNPQDILDPAGNLARQEQARREQVNRAAASEQMGKDLLAHASAIPTNPNSASGVLGEVAGNITTALPAMIPGAQPGMAALWFGSAEGNERAEIEQRRQRGEVITPAQENLAAFGSGTIEAGMELVGLKAAKAIGTPLLKAVPQVVKTAGEQGVKAALKPLGTVGTYVAGAVAEGAVEEGATTLAQNALAKGVYDEDRAVTEGLGRSALVGGLAGGPVAVAGGIAERGNVQRTERIATVAQHTQLPQEQIALVDKLPQNRQTVAADSFLRATGRKYTWFAADSTVDGFIEPESGRMYLNANRTGGAIVYAAAHEATHAVEGPELQAWAAENPDLVRMAAEQYGAWTVAGGRPDVAGAVAADPAKQQSEALATLVGLAATNPEVQARMIQQRPGLLVRIADAIRGILDKVRGRGQGREKLVRQQMPFLEILQQNAELARQRLVELKKAEGSQQQVQAPVPQAQAVPTLPQPQAPAPQYDPQQLAAAMAGLQPAQAAPQPQQPVQQGQEQPQAQVAEQAVLQPSQAETPAEAPQASAPIPVAPTPAADSSAGRSPAQPNAVEAPSAAPVVGAVSAQPATTGNGENPLIQQKGGRDEANDEAQGRQDADGNQEAQGVQGQVGQASAGGSGAAVSPAPAQTASPVGRRSSSAAGPAKKAYTKIPPSANLKTTNGATIYAKVPGETRRRILRPGDQQDLARVPEASATLLNRVRTLTDEVWRLEGRAGTFVAPAAAVAEAEASLRSEGIDPAATAEADKQAVKQKKEKAEQTRQRLKADRPNRLAGIGDHLKSIFGSETGALHMGSDPSTLNLEEALEWANEQPKDSEAYAMGYLYEQAKDDPRGTRYQWVTPAGIEDGARIQIGKETLTVERDPDTDRVLLHDGITTQVADDTRIPAKAILPPKQAESVEDFAMPAEEAPELPDGVTAAGGKTNLFGQPDFDAPVGGQEMFGFKQVDAAVKKERDKTYSDTIERKPAPRAAESEEDAKIRGQYDPTATPELPLPAPAPQPAAKPVNWGTQNTVITKDRYEQLKAQWKAKTGQVNAGFDPEMAGIAMQMAAYHVEAGARRFGEFARAAVADLGESIRPYLRSAYLAARNMPGMEALRGEMDKAADVEDMTDEQIGAVLKQAESSTPSAPQEDTIQTEQDDADQQSSVLPAAASGPRKPVDGSVGQDGADALGAKPAGDGEGAAGVTVPPVGGDSGPGERQDDVRGTGGERDESAGGTGDGAGGARPATDPRTDDAAGSERGEDESGAGADRPAGGQQADTPANADNYLIRDAGALHQGGLKAKFRANVEAIRLMRRIEAEGRSATPAEQDILAGYTGWGAMPGAFNDGGNAGDWTAERDEIKALLTDEEFAAAARSTLNAHYTAGPVVAAMWKMVRRLGFTGGRALEPAMGVGNFFGLLPAELRAGTHLTGVELDRLTGHIARLLYPRANVQVKGFQDLAVPDGFFDLAISNFPFGDYRVHDPAYNRHRANIHDYFFLKSLDKVRPGGLVVAITSTGTMDKANSSIRQAMHERADLVAAIRLPGGAFKQNAGTDVVTDILILRRRAPGEAASGPAWMNLAEVADPDGGQAIPVNEYFASHPKQILGRLDRSGTMYAGGQVNVSPTGDVAKMLEQAIGRLPEGIFQPSTTPTASEPQPVDEPGKVKDGAFVVKNGKLYRRQKDSLIPHKPGGKDAAKTQAIIADTIGVRDALREVMGAQLRQGTEAEKSAARRKLAKAYDAFVKDHGPLHRQQNARAFAEDPDAPLMLALEKYDPKTGTAAKTDVFRKDTIRGYERPSKADSPGEALGISLNETGHLNVARVAELLGKSEQEAGELMVREGLGYQNPAGGWESSEQYLSGNVRKKLVEAREAAAADARYAPNVSALEKVQPSDVPYDEIDVRLGAPWVPTDDVAQFSAELLGGDANHVQIRYLGMSGEWLADYTPSGERRWRGSPQDGELFGTHRAPFMDVLEAALNNKTIIIRDKVDKDTTVVNHEESAAANAKVADLRERFKEWVWQEDARRHRLHRYYNDTFNNLRPVQYDGKHLTFPGMAPAINGEPFKLMDHQRNGVWRTISTGTGLYAHEVGTGKTYTMVAAAMELRRLGLARKPVIAALKSTMGTIIKQARELYPNARVLAVEKFDAQNRRKVVAQIATGDWDLVILTHDNLDMLPMSTEVQAGFIQRELDELESVLREVNAADDAQPSYGRRKKKSDNRLVKRLEKAKARLEERLKEAMAGQKDNVVTFEETGIDQLFVDEAHKYKSLPVYTKQDRIKGVPSSRSDRATAMWMRAQWLQQMNGGRGVVFATGTPVTNTMAELYTMQRYLQMNDLQQRGIAAFDAWSATFGEVVTSMEYTVTGEYKPVSRFAKFVNLPELLQIARSIMDVKRAVDIPGFKRPKRMDRIEAVPMSQSQVQYLGLIRARAAAIKSAKPEKGQDNMLSIASDARKSAIDMRMVDAGAEFDPDGKVALLIANVLKLHQENPGATQMIFSDIGVNPTEWGFSLYRDIVDRLVTGGLPREKIINFGDLTDAQKKLAADRLHHGEALVGIGSTDKLGTGVNAQKHLLALHHIDVPWLPGNLEQRDGRGWRQGNKNEKVHIHRYVTEGSFDTFMWQVVDKKTRFIHQAIDGKDVGRVARDEDGEELSPAQVMAIASGNPLLLEKVQLDKDLSDTEAASRRHQRNELQMRDAARALQVRASGLGEHIADLQEDAKAAAAAVDQAFSIEIGDQTFSDRDKASSAFITHAGNFMFRSSRHRFGSFRGFELYIDRSGNDLIVEGKTTSNGVPNLVSVETRTRPDFFNNQIEKTRQQIDNAKSDLDKLQGQMGKPFSKQASLEELRKKRDELQAKLTAQANPPAAPAQPDTPPDNPTPPTQYSIRPDESPVDVESRRELLQGLQVAGGTLRGVIYADGSMGIADSYAFVHDDILKYAGGRQPVARLLLLKRGEKIYATVTGDASGSGRDVEGAQAKAAPLMARYADKVIAGEKTAAYSVRPERDTMAGVTEPQGAGRTTPPEKAPQRPGGNQWNLRDPEIVTAIGSRIEDGKHEFYGLRVITADPRTQKSRSVKTGDVLKPSHIWEDNNTTGQMLQGTSVIEVRSSDPEDIRKAMLQLRSYHGKQIVLVGGDNAKGGEDEGEAVIRNPVVLQAWNRAAEDSWKNGEYDQSIASQQTQARPSDQVKTKFQAGDVIENGRGETATVLGLSGSNGNDAILKVRLEDGTVVEWIEYNLAKKNVEQSFNPTAPATGGDAPAQYSVSPDTAFADPVAEARFQAARGIQSPSIWDALKTKATEAVQAFTRHFPYLDTRQKDDASLANMLRLREARIEAAPGQSKRLMEDWLRPIAKSKADYDRFGRLLILPDILKDVEAGLYEGKELPFGFADAAAVQAEYDRLQAGASPAVLEALKKRAQAQRQIAQKMVDLKLLPAEVLQEDRYYHRQVMEYVNLRENAAIGGKGPDAKLHKKGFQQQRTGGGDFNTAYEQAEGEYLTHALRQIATAETLQRIEDQFDQAPALRKQAKRQNLEAAFGGAENYRRFLQLKRLLAEAGDDREAKALIHEELDPLWVTHHEDSQIAQAMDKLYTESGATTKITTDEGIDFDVDDAELAGMEPFKLAQHILAKPDGFSEEALLAARWFLKAISNKKAKIQELAGKDFVTWQDLLPADYTLWSPKAGTAFARILSIPEQIVQQIASGDRPFSESDVREMFARVPGKQLALPEHFARQLDYQRSSNDGWLDQILGAGLASWKQWKLLNPLSALRYNLNNTSGDVDVVIAAAPHAVARMPAALRDLVSFYRGKASPALKAELERAMELAVTNSGENLAEIPDISDAGVFKALTGRYTRNPLKRGWKKYWDTVRDYTTLRENVARLAAWREAKELLASGKSPRWASRKVELDAIPNREEKAAKLSRDLVGDYGNISTAGQTIRRRYIPFFSWMEINAPRYYRLFANAAAEGRTGRTVAATAGKVGLNLTTMTVKAAALYALVHIFNAVMWPDEEDGFEDGRLRLILGRDANGKTFGVKFEGAFADTLRWFSLHDLPSKIGRLKRGEASAGDVAIEMAKATPSRFINAAFPVPKTLGEAATGKAIFPDPFNPRPIRDRLEHMAKIVDADAAVRYAKGIPQDNPFARAVVETSDSGQSAYQRTRGVAGDWLEKQGIEKPSGEPTERSNALFYHRQATAKGDAAGAKKWLERYYELGGTKEGLDKSLEMAHPLQMVPVEKREAFVASLSPDQQQKLKKAEDWYYRTYHTGQEAQARRKHDMASERSLLTAKASAYRRAREDYSRLLRSGKRAEAQAVLRANRIQPREMARLRQLNRIARRVAMVRKQQRLGRLSAAMAEQRIARYVAGVQGA